VRKTEFFALLLLLLWGPGDASISIKSSVADRTEIRATDAKKKIDNDIWWRRTNMNPLSNVLAQHPGAANQRRFVAPLDLFLSKKLLKK
jgi:hypothetical protein